jgi:hypothetical protein
MDDRQYLIIVSKEHIYCNTRYDIHDTNNFYSSFRFVDENNLSSFKK